MIVFTNRGSQTPGSHGGSVKAPHFRQFAVHDHRNESAPGRRLTRWDLALGAGQA
jgi:hypothetical protein